jgi:DNA-directed RNA polymerase subunit L
MEELFKLVEEYMVLHPNAENPLNYFNALEFNDLLEALKNANGKVINLIDTDKYGYVDGGRLA